MHNYTQTCLHEHLNTTAREHTKTKTNTEGTLHIDIDTHTPPRKNVHFWGEKDYVQILTQSQNQEAKPNAVKQVHTLICADKHEDTQL